MGAIQIDFNDRISFGVGGGPSSCVNAICQIHRLTVTCAPRLSQLLALEVFKESHHLEKPSETYAARRAKIIQECETLQLPMVCPQGAFYLWLNVKAYTQETLAFCQQLHRETSVLAIPGEAFGEEGRGFIRLSYAVHLDTFLKV